MFKVFCSLLEDKQRTVTMVTNAFIEGMNAQEQVDSAILEGMRLQKDLDSQSQEA